MSPKSFLAFFLEWAAYKGWTIPEIHYRMCYFLEHSGPLALMMVFRGAGKSTLMGIYNAWRYWSDPAYRILHQGDQDKTAYKTSRETRAILLRHPWTREEFATSIRGEIEFWWVPGNEDERNPSMQAAGIMSNITSSRADEIQNDDVEVPKNIQTPEAREKLRYRLGEQIHILVPGGKKLFVGTPHTHESLYEDVKQMGADTLIIPMFGQEHRAEEPGKRIRCGFRPEYVFHGIGKTARCLEPEKDYFEHEDGISFIGEPPSGIVDLYRDSAWPERFTRAEMDARRKETRTINEWDSQYQLHSKPVHELRLNPDKMKAYDLEPKVRRANGEVVVTLGNARLAGVKARWDCSLGKINSDASAVAILYTDEAGNLYWHRSEALTGELEEFGPDDRTLVGGQIKQLIDLLVPLNVTGLTIETNGPGGFVPAIARKHLKRYGIAVKEDFETANKQSRILDAFDAPLSSGFMYAHVSVLDGPAAKQMRDFNPKLKNQPDDYIDSAAGAITDTPVRIGREVGEMFGISNAPAVQTWGESAGVHEVNFEH